MAANGKRKSGATCMRANSCKFVSRIEGNMEQQYNPIVRTFNRLRAVLVGNLGLTRQQVRPNAELAAVIPVPNRRQVWRQMRQQGLRVLPLELGPRVGLFCG